MKFMNNLKKIGKDLYDDKFKRFFIFFLILIALFMIFNPLDSGPANIGDYSGPVVHFFHSQTCPHCQAQKIFNEDLKKEFPDVKWIYHDVGISSESQLYAKMALESGLDLKTLGVPGTFMGDSVVVGFGSPETTGVELREKLSGYVSSFNETKETVIKADEKEIEPKEKEFEKVVDLPIFGQINVLEVSLPVLAIVLGFVDGMNPCAMWVLVYMITLIMDVGDKRKIWFIVGTFVAASGILYFLFMTAWLNAFLFLGYIKPLTIIIGLVALYFGITSLKSYIETKGAIECEIGDAESKKKTMTKMKELVASPLTIATIIGIIGLAFVVNSIEFVCSAALPAIFTQVLAISNLSGLSYYLYIALYTFFFMLDDLVIFGLAALAINKFTGEKYAKYSKLIGAIIMIVLGVMMVFFPHVLAGG